MKYATPQLVVLGTATALVLGGDRGFLDNGGTDVTQPIAGVALGLDD